MPLVGDIKALTRTKYTQLDNIRIVIPMFDDSGNVEKKNKSHIKSIKFINIIQTVFDSQIYDNEEQKTFSNKEQPMTL